MRNILWQSAVILALAHPMFGEIIGGHQFQVDFTKPADANQKATWSVDGLTVGTTDQGLGWDGLANSSRDGWIMTQPIGTGLSWRPAQSVRVHLSVSPPPAEVTMPDGQKFKSQEGWAYARYSADARHWSTWQALTSAPPITAPKSREFAGIVAVPYRERAEYDRRRLDFARRQDVPWDSDEEDLARRIIQNEPDYFKDPIPFAGYVQFLFESTFPAGQRITGLTADLGFVVSGMHHPPRDPAMDKDRDGPWRFKATQPGPATQPQSSLPHATVEGRTITLHLSGATLRAPESWFGQSRSIVFTPYLSRGELEQVKISNREWQREFAQIVNAVLPFEACSAQFGSGGWGPTGSSYAVLHVRAYVMDGPMGLVLDRFAEAGLAEARKLASEWFARGAPAGITSPAAEKQWAYVRLSMNLWFNDYGGRANIDLYAREFGAKTVVLIFMYAEHPHTPAGTIDEIVESFQWQR